MEPHTHTCSICETDAVCWVNVYGIYPHLGGLWPGYRKQAVCEGCGISTDWMLDRRDQGGIRMVPTWRQPQPCVGCGRPVYNWQQRRILNPYCCDRCAWWYQNHLRSLRSRRLKPPRRCCVCGAHLPDDARTDARTCSTNCRSALHRRRQKDLARWIS